MFSEAKKTGSDKLKAQEEAIQRKEERKKQSGVFTLFPLYY